MPADPPPPPAPPVTRPDDGQGAVVAERKPQKAEPPRMYQVVLLNDDYTPMEFVVMVLQEYFKRDLETATQIMLKIHHEGRGVWLGPADPPRAEPEPEPRSPCFSSC